MKHKKLTAIVLALAMLLGLMPIDIGANVVHADNGNNIKVELYKGKTEADARQFVLDYLLNDKEGNFKKNVEAGKIKIENVKIRHCGNKNIQVGSFVGANPDGASEKDKILGFDKGVALSTGNLKDDLSFTSAENNISKSFNAHRKDKLVNVEVNDPASIAFDITIADELFGNEETKELTIEYAIGSEEYTKYSIGNYNDRFGIMINGEINHAKVPNTTDEITIANVNQVNNTDFFRCNTKGPKGKQESLGLKVNLNGLTKTFTTSIKLHKGQTERLKFLIGDYGDCGYDSVLFIKLGSMEFKTFDAGQLSVAKEGNKVVITRKPTVADATGTDGTISFMLVETNFEGEKVETVYTIPSGQKTLELPISTTDEDKPNTIANDTTTVLIKNPQMGATIGDNNEATLKIPAPELALTGTKKTEITISGKAGASITLYKKGVNGANDATAGTYVLDSKGKAVVTGKDIGKYYAKAKKTIDGEELTSATSNVVNLVKAPVLNATTTPISGVTGEAALTNAINGITKATAKDGDGNNIAANRVTETGKNIPTYNSGTYNGKYIPGHYSVKWSVTDNGITVTKARPITIKPVKPDAHNKNFKESKVTIKGMPGATAIVYDSDGNKYAEIELDATNGKGEMLDPPNGNYTIKQKVNGVLSDAFDSVNINRNFTEPKITITGFDSNNANYKANYTDDHIANEAALVYVLNASNEFSYTEEGATATDKEDDKMPKDPNSTATPVVTVMENGKNTYLNPKIKVKIEANAKNPAAGKTVAIDKQGNATDATKTFNLFVGKYVFKYSVIDSDDMSAKASKLVVVKPRKPGVTEIAQASNNDARFRIDALSAASVFLYRVDESYSGTDLNKKYIPVNVVDGKLKDTPRKVGSIYTDGKHTKIKMTGDEYSKNQKQDKFVGLPNGKYVTLQRMFGLNSDYSDEVTVKRSVNAPKITVKGLLTVSLEKGDDYSDAGATAYDPEDKDLTVTTTGDNVDTSEIGIHNVTYSATDTTNTTVTVTRKVIVRPKIPTIIVGDIDEDGKFTENENGNDIKIVGEPNATAQVVKGKNKQGSLYKATTLNGEGVGYVKNIEKNKGTDYEYAVFQTKNNVQSLKGEDSYFDINKANTKPKLELNHKVISIEKGEKYTVDLDFVKSATDDEDGDLKDSVFIYQALGANGKVTGAKASSVKLDSDDTQTIGVKSFYYQVKDSDGNTMMKVKQLEILPKAPQLEVKKSSVKAKGLEKNAVVELYIVDKDGKATLVETKKADNQGSDVEFTNIATGKYHVKQVVKSFESAKSKNKAFANPAYVNLLVIDKDDAKLAGATVTIKDKDVKVDAEDTDEKGYVTIGVDSADKFYNVYLKDNKTAGKPVYKLKAKSSEDKNKIDTSTTVVGSLLKGENKVDIEADYVKVLLKKQDSGEYVETHLAKAHYENGEYILTHLKEGKTYRVEIGYKVDKDDSAKGVLALAKFDVTAGAKKGSVKVANYQLKEGTVKDKNSDAIKGVKLELYPIDRDGNADYNAGLVKDVTAIAGVSNKNGYLTGDDGKYAFSLFDGISYVVVASKFGYNTKEVKVDAVEGNLLGVDITLEKGTKSSKHRPNTGVRNLDDKDDGDKDKSNSDAKSNSSAGAGGSANKVKNEVSKPKENNGLDIIKDVKPKSLTAGSKKSGNTYVDNNEKVDSDSYVAYHSDNKDGNDKVTESPNKGTLFTNPISGDIIYIPNKNEAGMDSFVISSKDKDGNNIKVKKNITIKNKPDKVFGKRDALVLELSANERRGFTGEQFNFTLDYKNDLNRDVKNGNIAVEIPQGFKLVDSKYQAKNGFLIVPFTELKKGASASFDFKLQAEKPAVQISKVKAVLQEAGSDRIYPEAVSSLDVNVLETGKMYYVKPYIKGYPDGKFDQAAPVTRAEVAAMLTRCLQNEGAVMDDSITTTFKDVDPKEWYAGYVDKSSKYGLFGGFEDGTFRPSKKITRAELAKVIGNYLKLNISEAGVIEQPYNDVKNHWARDEINTLNRYGISIGYKDGTFKPNQEISRQETVTMINNMLYRYELPHVGESFNDLDSDHWSFGDIESAYRGYSFNMDENKKLNIKESK